MFISTLHGDVHMRLSPSKLSYLYGKTAHGRRCDIYKPPLNFGATKCLRSDIQNFRIVALNSIG